MASHRAPKQWCLTKQETVNTFENWRQNLLCVLSLDNNYTGFLSEDAWWQKKAAVHPHRGLTNDADDVPAGTRRTAQQQDYMLELMLGQIANYCPIISRTTIVKNSPSLTGIWQVIRLHYGFQFTGARFIDFADIRLEPTRQTTRSRWTARTVTLRLPLCTPPFATCIANCRKHKPD